MIYSGQITSNLTGHSSSHPWFSHAFQRETSPGSARGPKMDRRDARMFGRMELGLVCDIESKECLICVAKGLSQR